MADIQMINCHIHTFTMDHVPFWFPNVAGAVGRHIPWLAPIAATGGDIVGQEHFAAWARRMNRMRNLGARASQRDIFQRVRRYYPSNTRFVILPMEMAYAGHGKVKADFASQMADLFELKEEFGNQVMPFTSLWPHDSESVALCESLLDDDRVAGLKLYPRLGFPPHHPVLMERIYPRLIERNIPVMSHCSGGPTMGKGMSLRKADEWSAPQAFDPVLDRHRDLRVCLAHFGGQDHWRDYIEHGLEPGNTAEREANWLTAILDRLKDRRYSGLYTDVSYTLFDFESFMPFLKVFLGDPDILGRVLFGSDFYMTQQEKTPERAVSFRMRDQLGEAIFGRIAQFNPEVWLGERADVAPAAPVDPTPVG